MYAIVSEWIHKARDIYAFVINRIILKSNPLEEILAGFLLEQKMSNPKVTLKPSEQIIQAANTIEYIEVDGKKYGLKKPSLLAQFDIVEALGETAQNATYMQMVMPLLWVVDIDGDSVAMPSTKREVRALIQRVGEDGMKAIMEHLMAKAAEIAPEIDTVKK
jgi:hypothetical protein